MIKVIRKVVDITIDIAIGAWVLFLIAVIIKLITN